MNDIIVFEGATEVIVGAAANINKLIEDWFLNGERNLDDYDTTLIDGSEGLAISCLIHGEDGGSKRIDVTELMPNVLREALIEKGLLTDEG